MTIQMLNSRTVCYISSKELQEKQLSPDCLTTDQTLSLLRSAFTQVSLPIPEILEIEAFYHSQGVLLFVYTCVSPHRQYCVSTPIFS